MNPYFAPLKLPFEVDLRHLAEFDWPAERMGHVKVNGELADPRLLTLLDDAGYFVIHAESFHTPPNLQMRPHIDGPVFGCDRTKLNFVYGGEGSHMVWWELKDPSFRPTANSNVVGAKYISVPHHMCVEAARTKIIGPTLVNVGRIHSMENTSSERRWCVSLVLGIKGTQTRVEFPDALVQLKEVLA
jgi:hypothetical protein